MHELGTGVLSFRDTCLSEELGERFQVECATASTLKCVFVHGLVPSNNAVASR